MQRKRISGGNDLTQLACEITVNGREKRKALIDQLFSEDRAIRITVSAKDSLAMKADLQIPWRQMRRQVKHTMQQCTHQFVIRWYKEFGIEIASEGKLRAEARQYVDKNLHTEWTPFTFALKDGRNSISVPMAYITDLW